MLGIGGKGEGGRVFGACAQPRAGGRGPHCEAALRARPGLSGENIGPYSPKTLFNTLTPSLAKCDMAQYRHHLEDIINVGGGSLQPAPIKLHRLEMTG